MTENEYKRIEYKVRRNDGLCTRCGREDAYTMAGRSMCAECAENARERKARQYADDDRRQRMYAQHRNGKQKRRDAGICPECGRPATPEYSTCEYCRAKHRNYMRRYRNTAPRGENGLCWQCNKNEAIPGKRVCQTCYERLLDSAEKGRISQEKMKVNGWRHSWKTGNDFAFAGTWENR